MTAKEQGLPVVAVVGGLHSIGWTPEAAPEVKQRGTKLCTIAAAEQYAAALASDTGERGVGGIPTGFVTCGCASDGIVEFAPDPYGEYMRAADVRAALRAQPAGGGELLDCGHHNSLMLKSAETGLPLYCELCDALTCARDNASDAADWRAKFEELQADDAARQWLNTMRDLLLPKHEGEWREFVAMVKAADSGVEFKDCRTRTPPAQAAEGVEYRMWDSQWVNVVNHERAYRDWEMEEAINHAVKLTEQAMAKNVRDGKWPPARTLAQGGGNER